MKIFNALTLFVLGLAGLLQAQSEQESLGDVARRNNHQKKATLVVTEDNISSIGGTVSVVGSEQVKSSDTGAPAAPKKTADNAPTAPSSAKTAEVADLQKNLNSAKQELEGWKQAVKQYQDLLATESDEFRRQTYQTALENDRINVTRSQQKVNEAQAALARAQQAASAAAGTDKSSNQTSPANGTKEP